MPYIHIEIPDEIWERLQKLALPNISDFVLHSVIERLLKIEDGLTALDELERMFSDEDWTMDDILKMKREAWEIEERKLNRF